MWYKFNYTNDSFSTFLSDTKKITKGRPKRPEMMSFKDLPPLNEEQEKYLRESLVCIGDKEKLPPARKNLGRQPPINVRT